MSVIAILCPLQPSLCLDPSPGILILRRKRVVAPTIAMLSSSSEVTLARFCLRTSLLRNKFSRAGLSLLQARVCRSAERRYSVRQSERYSRTSTRTKIADVCRKRKVRLASSVPLLPPLLSSSTAICLLSVHKRYSRSAFPLSCGRVSRNPTSPTTSPSHSPLAPTRSNNVTLHSRLYTKPSPLPVVHLHLLHSLRNIPRPG